MSGYTLRADINRKKRQLMAKAKKRGIYENFGQKEVSKLKDKWHYYDLIYGSELERSIAALIDSFDNWCMNYTGRD